MTPKTFALSAVVALLVMGSATYAQAQSTVQAKIPFEFSLEGQTFPAGVYMLSTDPANFGMLTIANRAGTETRFFTVRPADLATGSVPVLRFNRYGTRYFLSSLVVPGVDITLSVPRSAAEREMAARMDRSQSVAVYASRH